MDRGGNRGTISVAMDRTSKEKIYHYQVESGSRDPLGYESIGSMAGRFGTYSQWSKWSNDAGLTYQDAVGGMGSYLYSSSPAIGDITITHDFGWNFGENLGGHGGIEAGEKLTVMLMSGPGLQSGSELMSQAAWSADGDWRIQSQSFRTYPSVLDVAPTALDYLGYPTLRGEGELTRFARNGFAKQLAEWTREQKASCDRDGVSLIYSLAMRKQIQLPDDFKDYLKTSLGRLCQFEGSTEFKLPDYNAFKEDGNLLLSQ